MSLMEYLHVNYLCFNELKYLYPEYFFNIDYKRQEQFPTLYFDAFCNVICKSYSPEVRILQLQIIYMDRINTIDD